MFDLDEWGYAWLKESETDGAAAQLVRETARLCPRRAILVKEVALAEAPAGHIQIGGLRQWRHRNTH